MDEKLQAAQARHATLDRDHLKHVDPLSLAAFITAGVLGIGTIVQNIRQRFYYTFVEGYNRARTPFTEIYERYNGQGAPLTARLERGEINHAEYIVEHNKLGRALNSEINVKLREFRIPTENWFKDWTLGTVRRWELLGRNSRINTSIGFASVAAISVGAVSLLRHNKRTLDHIEDSLDRIDRPERNTAPSR